MRKAGGQRPEAEERRGFVRCIQFLASAALEQQPAKSGHRAEDWKQEVLAAAVRPPAEEKLLLRVYHHRGVLAATRCVTRFSADAARIRRTEGTSRVESDPFALRVNQRNFIVRARQSVSGAPTWPLVPKPATRPLPGSGLAR